ncbi:MAG: deoxyribodipyrimidine photo-lyase [Saprospiraceae bacterium]|nr:deoxyribodipyrimidine photo-lyase [Saprospiraceae bacterium]
MRKITIVWLRRDLRLFDQAAFYHALKQGDDPVVLLFIFDDNILNDLANPRDLRVNFIYKTIKELKLEVQKLGSDIIVKKGDPLNVWKKLMDEFEVTSVFFNRDYEPYAKDRDNVVKNFLEQKKVRVFTFKDHLIFESNEVTKTDGDPYVVFTPYKKVWLEHLHNLVSKGSGVVPAFKTTSADLQRLIKMKSEDLFTLKSIGFEELDFEYPDAEAEEKLLLNYDKTRDFPALDGTSRLGIHLRFGTISLRGLVDRVRNLNAVYLSELIWREFYSHILDRFPEVINHSFRPQYDQIEWLNDENDFKRWCAGKTGYPIVDAGMRQLNQTGYMHNRVRMITASFLTKHLLIDWRWGEAYFASKLLDYDLASNNGGWQWAAGSGTDAAPYFRIFNPESQQKKFDPEWKYVKTWVPEFGTKQYCEPMVDHKMARLRCMATYKKALNT